MSAPAVYSSKQMLAHWIVVFLVIFQYLTGGAMEAAFWDEARTGGAIVHGLLGLTILAFMLWRVYLRANHGAPPPPDTEPGAIQTLSRSVHYAFYTILIAMPVFGLAAVLTGIGILATAHGIAAWALLALAVLHVAGAAWHGVKGDGVVHRMARREPPTVQ